MDSGRIGADDEIAPDDDYGARSQNGLTKEKHC